MDKKGLWAYGIIVAGFLIGIHFGSKAVTVFAGNQPPEGECCVIIDPGHGGEDGGAISCTGKPESTFNLEIALCLNDLLHFLGHDTKLLRSTDTSIYTKGETIAQKKISDLKERVRMVNETENALLISIHQNHFPDSRYSGAQVFYAETEGSEHLARQMQDALVKALNPNSRRKSKKSSGVYVMEHIQHTGVLVECGFLSNPEEEKKLQDPEYQKKLCCVIAATVSGFLSNT